jgi:hypothetical protein
VTDPLRPREFALLILASGELAPRQRARDQQADRAGLDLKRRVLVAVADADPQPDELEAALMAVVEEFGPPTGPTRAVALSVLDEWRAASASPDWAAHLIDEAARPRGEGGRRRGGHLPG